MGNCVSSQSQAGALEKQAAGSRGRGLVAMRKVYVHINFTYRLLPVPEITGYEHAPIVFNLIFALLSLMITSNSILEKNNCTFPWKL